MQISNLFQLSVHNLTVLKILELFAIPGWVLWQLARCCKQLRLLCHQTRGNYQVFPYVSLNLKCNSHWSPLSETVLKNKHWHNCYVLININVYICIYVSACYIGETFRWFEKLPLDASIILFLYKSPKLYMNHITCVKICTNSVCSGGESTSIYATIACHLDLDCNLL